MTNNQPAILGGKPVFEQVLPITKPTLPAFEDIAGPISSIFMSGMITNADTVKDFEDKVQQYLSCKHAIALNSCTSGLMLILKALDIKGEVILPSFTFYATGHSILWNGLTPVFVDCDSGTYNIDVKKIEKAITPQTSAILAVHIFGNPADVEDLESLAQKYNLKLIFDAAHGFGAEYMGNRLGSSGDAESFSLSPTKLITAGEGGIVTTNNDELADKIKIGRTYGDRLGNYDCDFLGLSARMPEINALIGIKCMEMLEQNINNRQRLVEQYKQTLAVIPGISFQTIRAGNKSSWKDFSIKVDEQLFGIGRDILADALTQENITTKKYFYPPLHQQRIFKEYYRTDSQDLRSTEEISLNSLSIPLYSHLKETEVERVCLAIRRIHQYAEAIRQYR